MEPVPPPYPADPSREPTGYLHPAYAESLAEFGQVRALPGSGAFLLVRPTPAGGHRDGRGPYPLLACRNWAALADDLTAIGDELVSVTAVTDPFGAYDEQLLRRTFPDLVRPFKRHLVVDLAAAPDSFVSKHHRRNAERSLREVAVDLPPDAGTLLDDWVHLYGHLARRHSITGIARFSRQSFAGQLKVPGLVAVRATWKGSIVGMLLWYVHSGVGYYHLGAYDDDGYRCGASFALFSTSLAEFRRRGFRWLDLGAAAGLDGGAQTGLSRFKAGWSNHSRFAFLCGRVLDRRAYDTLAASIAGANDGYFPAYRAGEISRGA